MDKAIDYRSKCKHFRTLIIGRANAGKTTLLKKVCNSIEDPEIFSPSGKMVIESAAFRRQTVCSFESITINRSSIPPLSRSRQRFDSLYPSNSHSLSISQRGIHDIEYQLIFKSNPQFIFHDSRGFESGSLDEIETVKSFIAKCARSQKLSEQLHAVWCGGYDLTREEELTGAMTGIVSLQIPIGRYWRLTGISSMSTVTGKVSDDFPVLR
jgi:hypothetical protein